MTEASASTDTATARVDALWTAAGFLMLLLSAFLPWVEPDFRGESANGLADPFGRLVVLALISAGLLTVDLAVTARRGTGLVKMAPSTMARVHLGLGVATLGLVAAKFLWLEGQIRPGVWFALAAASFISYHGYVSAWRLQGGRVS